MFYDVISERKFLNEELFKEYEDFGGVRIEDMVLVTEDGCENLTIVPRTVDDIEEVMNYNKKRTAEMEATSNKRRKL